MHVRGQWETENKVRLVVACAYKERFLEMEPYLEEKNLTSDS